MVIVVSRLWFPAITFFGLIIIRERNYSPILLNHEYIHSRQQKEMLYIFAYLLYYLEFILKAMYYGNFKKAYTNISFEVEAHTFQTVIGYAANRKPYAFFKYIFNKKNTYTMLTIDFDSDQSIFTSLYALPVGSIIKYTKNPEGLLRAIESNKPNTLSAFKIKFAQPGTNAFTLYGPNTAMVITRTVVTP